MNLVISNLAQQDLAAIEKYTRDKWGVHQADIYLEQIQAKVFSLLEQPYLGTTRADISSGYRCLQEGKHLIFYYLEQEAINIIGIPHSRMDLKKHLEL